MRTLLLTCVAMTAAGMSQQSIRVSVEGVRVDVLVLDGSNPVPGLRPDQFELRDSGVLQQISSVQYEDVPLSVMLALDVSESVTGTALSHLQEAAASGTSLLLAADRVALLTFSSEVALRVPWTADPQRIRNALGALTAAGSTSLHDAAHAALTLRDPEAGRTLVLVFSDGQDTSSWLPGTAALDVARHTDAVVYGVGLRRAAGELAGFRVDFASGLRPDTSRVLPTTLTERFLRALANETGGNYLEADRSDRLKETFDHVLREFRSRYLLTYTPRGVEAGGWHPIDVGVKDRRLKVTARRGYAR